MFSISGYPQGVLAVSLSSRPSDSFQAVKNSNAQNRLLSSQVSKTLVLDDSALAPIHNPLYDTISTSSTSAFGTDDAQNDQIYLYTVKEGDTANDVAKMYGVSVNTVLWANDISSKTTLKKGQVLIILPVSGVKYTVKKGDTVESVAKRFKAHMEDIVNFNNLDEKGDKLAVGDEIIIPNGEVEKALPPQNIGSNDWTPLPEKNGLILGYFIRPLTHGIKTQGVHAHNGVDIAAPIGTDILAVANGTVVLAKVGGWGGGYGNYVVIQHPNGMQTLYGHMNSVDVSVGDSVKQGQVIGQVGTTGRSTGPHLHIEIHKVGSVNPPNKFY